MPQAYVIGMSSRAEQSGGAAKFKLLLCISVRSNYSPSEEIRPALSLCTFPISSFLSLFCHFQHVENVLIEFGLSRLVDLNRLPSSFRSSMMKVLHFPAVSEKQIGHMSNNQK